MGRRCDPLRYAIGNNIRCWAPALFVTAAWALSISASCGCSFLKLNEDNFRREPPIQVDTIGFWCFNVEGSNDRKDISDWNFDNDFKKARAFGTTANVIGFFVWIFCLFVACAPFPPTVFYITGIFAMIACLFEGLKFWMLKSAYFCDGDLLGCTYDTMGKCSIAACVLWFLSSGLMYYLGMKSAMEPTEEEEEAAVMEDKEVEAPEDKELEAPEASLEDDKGDVALPEEADG